MAWFDMRLELERMTEQEWLTSTDPHICYELQFVTTDESPSKRMSQPSSRKLRLFACACCRRIWNLLTSDWAKECVLVAEAYCDGSTSEAELKAAFVKAPESLLRLGGWHLGGGGPIRVAEAAAAVGGDRSTWALVAARDLCAPDDGMPRTELPRGSRKYSPDQEHLDPVERAAQAKLLRDIYGNPFRPTTFESSWRTQEVAAIAQQMYESRDFSAMPILSDALLAAGCEDEKIISHCRSNDPHVRGCWVVDLVLEKH